MDAYSLLPLPHIPPRAPLPPTNAGNTCYLDAVLVALFADFDGWDGLLLTPNPSPLAQHLRTIVNLFRTGESISASTISTLRHLLITFAAWHPGRAQHDAAELFARLLDALHAPFVPLVNNLIHRATHDVDADHAPFTERLLWLSLYSRSTNHLVTMVDNYFYGEVRHGVRRRGAPPPGVDATISRSLIPAYTPTRETGETVSADRVNFATLTLPLAISRFNATSTYKDCSPVHIPTALPATSYVNPFANGAIHTLILRSIVCHLGTSIQHGHYVAYTYSPIVGWRRWDDMDTTPIRSVSGDVYTGLPEDHAWASEIRHNAYLLFYELVPGEFDHGGRTGPYKVTKINRIEATRLSCQCAADESIALQEQQGEIYNQFNGLGPEVSDISVREQQQIEADHDLAIREQILNNQEMNACNTRVCRRPCCQRHCRRHYYL